MPGRGHRLPAAWVIAACVALAALLAAGCDNHSKPQAVEDDPSSSSAPLGSPAPSTSALSASDGTSGNSQSGASMSAFPSAEAQVPAAIQVVQAFFDGLNYEIDNQGNESKLAPLFTGDCARCAASASAVHEIFSNGNSVQGGHYHVLSIDKAYATGATRVTVVVTESADPGRVLDQNGTLVQSYPGLSPTQQTFYLAVDHNPPTILAFLLTGGKGR